MHKYHIPIIVGTSRPTRMSLHVSKFILSQLKKIENITTELVDPVNFNLPFDGNDPENKDPKYTEITQKADGFIIVVPEYNHSFPGSLKRLLDSELKNYKHKPVVFAGVSSGPWGGTRAIESLISPIREMGLVSSYADMHFANVNSLFDEKGNILDEKYSKRVNKSVNELLWLVQTLKWGRENIGT